MKDMSWEVFDKRHHKYDEWFDESPGKEIFQLEVQCLPEASRGASKPWLEIGVGVCRYKGSCGGCQARAYGYFGNYKAPDPECINNQEVFPKLKREVKEE